MKPPIYPILAFPIIQRSKVFWPLLICMCVAGSCDRDAPRAAEPPAHESSTQPQSTQRLVDSNSDRIASYAEDLQDALDDDLKKRIDELRKDASLTSDEVNELLLRLLPHIRDERILFDVSAIPEQGSGAREAVLRRGFSLVRANLPSLSEAAALNMLNVIGEQDDKALRLTLLHDLSAAIDQKAVGRLLVEWIDANAFSAGEKAEMAEAVFSSLGYRARQTGASYSPDVAFNRMLIDRSGSYRRSMVREFTVALARSSGMQAAIEEVYRYNPSALDLVSDLAGSSQPLSAPEAKQLRGSISSADPSRSEIHRILDSVTRER